MNAIVAVPATPGAEPTWQTHRYPSALIDRVTLADGRAVTVRPVLPQDADAEQAMLAAMSPKSRLQRFHGVVNALPAAVLRQMTAIDYRRHLAIVAEPVCDDGVTRLVADARYVVDDDDDGSAEFAMAVVDDWQRAGLGGEMLRRLVGEARRRGIGRLVGRVLVGNVGMQSLLRSFGARTVVDRDDASVVVTTITP